MKERIERVISHYESLQKRYVKTHNGKMCEVTDTAIQALTPQLERESGCVGCETSRVFCEICSRAHRDRYSGKKLGGGVE